MKKYSEDIEKLHESVVDLSKHATGKGLDAMELQKILLRDLDKGIHPTIVFVKNEEELKKLSPVILNKCNQYILGK